MHLKIKYPKQIFLLRGNHETKRMTAIYNFLMECLDKYNQQIYSRIVDSFDFLPLCCVINNKYFCTHGGISRKLLSLQQINQIERGIQTPT